MPDQKKVKKTEIDKEQIVADFLGVHPKYFIYEGHTIRFDNWAFEHDGHRFNCWNPDKTRRP